MRHFMALAFALLFSLNISGQYEVYFHPNTLRFDFFSTNSRYEETYSFSEFIQEPAWAGSTENLIDTFYFGSNYVRMFDLASETLIYSRGFSTLSSEWRTTEEAKAFTRVFQESVLLPFPKKSVRIEIYSRNAFGLFIKQLEKICTLESKDIRTEKRRIYSTEDIHISGNTHNNLDIVILPEGYASSDMQTFRTDCQKFATELLSYKPYNDYSAKINIRMVMAPSSESGCDLPGENIWKNTLLDARFYTFGEERYCMTDAFHTVRDIAANAPYDQIYILVNSPKYGGGGIYNYYSLSVNSNKMAGKIIIHELGHGFTGLADEYYNSSVAYNDMYPTDLEPWEPNITTLVHFDRKWKSILEPNIPIPTPDSLEFNLKPGVFEGGGYSSKGVYRPAVDCLMNTFRENKFCTVCEKAIFQMLEFYTK
ncbi:MAG: M64 family metallopeptidase [Bacteroidales bacterium]|nr:M64 family metallopeptidase [Bacteroidales bacterium]